MGNVGIWLGLWRIGSQICTDEHRFSGVNNGEY